MKGIGALLIVLAVIYLIGWGGYNWIDGNMNPFGSVRTSESFPFLQVMFLGVIWLIAGAFGIIYVLLHAVVQNDVGFLLWSFIGGVACVVTAMLRNR
ncbi:MAG: hypothetical protein V1907_00520 [Candidatus Kerfeldbacteria bacterium]